MKERSGMKMEKGVEVTRVPKTIGKQYRTVYFKFLNRVSSLEL